MLIKSSFVYGIAPTALEFVDDARFHVVRNTIPELEHGDEATLRLGRQLRNVCLIVFLQMFGSAT